MKHVFGPVPSRRLGRSLGIDTVPLKTCNWNCVYCQLGRSVPVVAERGEYVPREEIVAEVEAALSEHDAGEIDWVTFVASGETTLHRGLGWLIRRVKAMTELPVAVITNGSLLRDAGVREELSAADAVLPSLDAGTEETYRRINRAHPSLTFEGHVRGLEEFRREFEGRLWIEVMLVRGVNDGDKELHALAELLARIGPDEVHLVAPTRPACEAWVAAPDERGMAHAAEILGRAARVVSASGEVFESSGSESPIEAILGIIGRHPMSVEEVERMLAKRAPERVDTLVHELEASGRAQLVERGGRRFWVSSATRFPDGRGGASDPS